MTNLPSIPIAPSSLVVPVLSLLAAASLPASELKVREAASAYPHTCQVEGGTIGVDYLSRSLPTPQGTQMIPGIVIVEVGVYPSPERSFHLTEGSFSLDWKGAEWPLGPAGPDFVLAQLLHPEWAYPEHGEGIDLQVGTVNRQGGDFDGIATGRTPRRYPRFPGPWEDHLKGQPRSRQWRPLRYPYPKLSGSSLRIALLNRAIAPLENT